MKRPALILAVVILLCANAVALILAARNRTGGPIQTIELTERELVLQNLGQEDSGVSLRLNWHRQEGDAFFERAKLEAVGFDFRMPSGRKGKEMLFLPRAAYAAFEYEGKAWEEWSGRPEAEKQQNRPGPVSRVSPTRLFPVDIAKTMDELRNRYPDQSRYLIVAATIEAGIRDIKDPKTGTILTDQCVGSVVETLPSQINVPLPFTRLLAPLTPEPTAEPRYTVALAYGRNLEPWITSVRMK